MRICLDSNVLVAAFATRGLCADLLRLVLTEHALLVTQPVLDEVERALKKKIRLPADRVAAVAAFLADYLAAQDEVQTPELGLRDPDDIAVVRSAIAAGAAVLVSGDKDLLEADLPLQVVSPRGLWDLLRSQ